MKSSRLTLVLLCFTSFCSAQPAYYRAGDIVTNFTLYARWSWTNTAGYSEGDAMRLSDFSGKVVFLEFFDPT